MKKYNRRLLFPFLTFIFFCSCLSFSSHAQAPQSYNSDEIYLQLKKLNVLGSVLYIAAHPDDENTRLLAFLSKDKLYRTGYMALTRGDGGQNLIGDEQGIELGLIRTQELLAARRVDGAEQFFSRAYDFGFSKSADEALKIWGHDKILSDVVWVIRKFQPDVIITRFPGDERAGHGHHQASEILAKEAFFAAADSTKFPEQFQYGVRPWQAKRILWNTFNFGNTNTTSENQFKIDVGGYNSILGKSYGEIASESRSQHKSQGFGVASQRGQAFEYFETTAGDAPTHALMDGIDTSWMRVIENERYQYQVTKNLGNGNSNGGGQQSSISNDGFNAGKVGRDVNLIQEKINYIITHYNFEHPENSIDSLVSLYGLIQRSLSIDDYWRKQKSAEIQSIIFHCAGLFAEATTNSEFAVQGGMMQVQFTMNKRSNANIRLSGIRLDDFDSTVSAALPVNENVSISKTIPIAKDREVSQPYWLAHPMDAGSYNVPEQSLIGSAQSAPAYVATFVFEVDGTRFFVARPVEYKHTDPVKGEVYQPLIVTAPLIVSLSPSIILTNVKPGTDQTNNPSIKVEYVANFEAVQIPVTVTLKQGASIILKKDTVENLEKGKTYAVAVPLQHIIKKGDGNEITASVSVKIGGHQYEYTHFLKTIAYEHIPSVHYFYQDAVKLVNAEVKTNGKNIGYIIGAGDKVPQALIQMGYNVTILDENNITDENLKHFDAVIAGVRTYNVDDWINGKFDVLMRYIQNGGNYIVQYNTAGFGATRMKIGPYDFTLSRTRVTDENADVHILLPGHTVLNFPNKITAKDFDGWIQERSIYQADQLDARYEAPLGMRDPGEPETNGSLIIAPYGKGNFVYTGLVFFRELPAAVPGAYRLMANLIALPKNK